MKNNDKLKIAVFATASLPIPPFAGYGGTQRGIYDFVKNMGNNGHSIHLFGPGDSDVKGLENVTLYSSVDKSLWVPNNTLSSEEKAKESERHYAESISTIYELDKKDPFDIINVRLDNVRILEEVVNKFGRERVVYGLHNITNVERIQAIKNLEIMCTAHCHDHKQQYNSLPNISVVPYGVDVHSYPFNNTTLSQSTEEPNLNILKKLKDEGKDYMITLGGIGKHKGQKTCISLSKETGLPLIIAGTPQGRKSRTNFNYHEAEVLPHINDENIIYFGNADEEQKKSLLKFAKGFLFPSGFEDTTWNEPFGRAPVEALSHGTPVIAYRKGSMKEVILNGYNGYLFENFNQAVHQVNQLGNISRKNVRDTAEKCFGSKRVAKDFEKLFYDIKANRGHSASQ